MMQVEQAVFASSDRGAMKGYQLIAKSAGVDRASSQELSRWSPTQFPEDYDQPWTINSFPIGDGQVAVTRTVLGGPEYSNRGASQVITRILLLQESQFAAYGYNAIWVAKAAIVMGYLRLSLDWGCQQLEPAFLPERPFHRGESGLDQEAQSIAYLLDEVAELICESRRVAVVGAAEPVELAGSLISRLPSNVRDEFSFTTGLIPAIRRPFQAHFLHRVATGTRRSIESQRIVVVDAT